MMITVRGTGVNQRGYVADRRRAPSRCRASRRAGAAP